VQRDRGRKGEARTSLAQREPGGGRDEGRREDVRGLVAVAEQGARRVPVEREARQEGVGLEHGRGGADRRRGEPGGHGRSPGRRRRVPEGPRDGDPGGADGRHTQRGVAVDGARHRDGAEQPEAEQRGRQRVEPLPARGRAERREERPAGRERELLRELVALERRQAGRQRQGDRARRDDEARGDGARSHGGRGAGRARAH
jgi:hypothetical protein